MDPGDRVVLYEAEEYLKRACMARHGQPYPEYPYIARKGHEAWYRGAYAEWEWDDPDRARATGYGISLRLTAAEDILAEKANRLAADHARWYDSLSPSEREAYDQALEGNQQTVSLVLPDGREAYTVSSGCLGESHAELYGSVEDYWTLEVYRGLISDEGANRVDEDKAYQEVVGAWSSCMRDRGFDAPDPIEAFSIAYVDDLDQLDLEFERAIAVADAECNQEVGLRAAGDKALAHVQRQMTTELHDWSERARGVADRALERAAHVLDVERPQE
jgi:hypothetical protein